MARGPVLAVACLLALALAPHAAAQPGARSNPSCSGGDCCWSGGNRARFCACQNTRQCATVRCAAGPPMQACEPPRGASVEDTAGPPPPRGGPVRLPGRSDCVCTRIYKPVCAGGDQFGNECEARTWRPLPHRRR
jgi:hypothetical protein